MLYKNYAALMSREVYDLLVSMYIDDTGFMNRTVERDSSPENDDEDDEEDEEPEYQKYEDMRGYEQLGATHFLQLVITLAVSNVVPIHLKPFVNSNYIKNAVDLLKNELKERQNKIQSAAKSLSGISHSQLDSLVSLGLLDEGVAILAKGKNTASEEPKDETARRVRPITLRNVRLRRKKSRK